MRHLCTPLILLVALGAHPRALSEDEVSLVAAVLERAVAVKDYLPDGHLLKVRPFLLREEIGGLRIPAEALGNQGAWIAKSRRAIQADADARDASVYFAVVESVTITGDVGTVGVGVDLAVSIRVRGGIVTCCALAHDQYRKAGKGWRFSKRLDHIMW